MAYLDALMPPDVEDMNVAQQIYPWMKRPTAPAPIVPPSAQPLPAMVAGRPPASQIAAPATPASVLPGSALSAVTVGPSAAQAAQPGIENAPLQPITLGPQAQPARPPTAADALAASKAPDLHGWKKAVDIAGQILAPGIEEAIPGSPGNYRTQVRPALEQRAKEEAATTVADMTDRKDISEIGRNEAEAAQRNAEAQKILNPEDKPEKYKAIVVVGANGEASPAIQYESGKVIGADGQEIKNPKMWEKPQATKTPSEEDKKIDDEIAAKPQAYPGGNIASNRVKARIAVKAAEAAAGRDTSTKDAARADRNYQFNAKELDNERKPLEATMQKISAATSNVDLKSPQADALLAPQILSLSAGGAGSGLRMNEAEIARIVGGRTVWEGIKASANKWSTDPSHPQIPEAQRGQMVQILQAAAQKGTMKSSILEWADGALVNTDDPKQQRQIVADARKFMNAVDEGKRLQRNKATGEFRIAPE